MVARFWKLTSNLYKDDWRLRQKRRAHLIEMAIEYPGPGPTPDEIVMQRLDSDQRMGAADLQRINDWPPRQRLLLLALTGWWRFVPDERWSEWIEECGADKPFPPRQFLLEEDQIVRNEILSNHLGISRNMLSQSLCRGKKLLLELDWGKRDW